MVCDSLSISVVLLRNCSFVSCRLSCLRGNSLSKDLQTFFSPATSTNSSGETLWDVPNTAEIYFCLPWGLFLDGHAQNISPGRHPDQMPKTPQLAPVNAKEQWLYSEPLLDVQAPHPKAEPSHSAQEAHFGCLYSRPNFFSHYQELTTIGE